jgi:hypothetical protein
MVWANERLNAAATKALFVSPKTRPRPGFPFLFPARDIVPFDRLSEYYM